MNLKRKTLIVIETGHLSKKAVSGGETIMPHMAKYLNSKYKITVILPHFVKGYWHDQKNITLIKLPANFFEKNNHPVFVLLNYIWRAIQTYLIIKKVQPETFIYSSTNTFPDILPSFILRMTNHRFNWIARIHHMVPPPTKRQGNFLVNLFAFMLDKFCVSCAKAADIIFALNHLLYRKLITIGFSKNRLAVLGAGVEDRYFETTQTKKIYDGIFLGRLHRTKGVLDLPHIWSLVTKTNPNAKLIIAGEISDLALFQALRSDIIKKGLQNKVEILGFVKQKEIRDMLSKSKLFLLTDHEAGFGLAALEAMAAGLPVVGWDLGVLGTAFKKGFVKVPVKNYDLFSQKVASLLGDRNLYQKLSTDARSEAQNHSWRTVAMKFSKHLDTMFP